MTPHQGAGLLLQDYSQQPQLGHLDQLSQQGQVCQADTFAVQVHCSVHVQCIVQSAIVSTNVAMYLIQLMTGSMLYLLPLQSIASVH